MTSQNDEYTLLLDHHNLRLLCKVCFPLSLVNAREKSCSTPELSRDSKQELLLLCEVDLIILGLGVKYVYFILGSHRISQRKFTFKCQFITL